MITIEEFNFRFGIKGGFPKLKKMIFVDVCRKNEIAKHFQVSPTTVSTWMENFFVGQVIDLRVLRRARRIEKIVEYMQTHSEFDAIQAFRHENLEYFAEALFLFNKQKNEKI